MRGLVSRVTADVAHRCDIALNHATLLTDDPSALPNAPGFKEHRHDQSIFSTLMWKHGMNGSEMWTSVPTRYGTS